MSDVQHAKPIELLAPARTRAIGIAAINCGADAVYIGAERFGAREDAANSVPDIEALAAYAHRYWARVYVTLNTLVRDDEFPAALDLIWRLYEAGIDGMIIQDPGLLECELPPLPLIASTQFDNTTAERVRFLEQVGFQRVILARELRPDEIQTIRQATTVELECFVHGALCVGYSGRCYLSYAIGGRSGNRGCCAQPCRQRYELRDADGTMLARDRYLLSLKDLNRSARLRELLQAGITSFKIEGRLKDAGYVMNSVGLYRRALDQLLDGRSLVKSSSGSSVLGFTPDPAKTFNRGFTDYFLRENARVASIDSPKSRGESIGSIKRYRNDSFELDSDVALASGDGLCFFDRRGRLMGTRVRRVQHRRVYPERMAGMAAGMPLSRNVDQTFQRALQRAKPARTIGVTIKLTESPEGLVLSATDADGVTATVGEVLEQRAAAQPERARATILKQLARLGGTEFHCTRVTLKSSRPYFLTVAELNRARRELVKLLREKRLQARPRARGGVEKNSIPCHTQRLGGDANVLNARARAFYRRHGVQDIAPATESVPVEPGTTVMSSRYCIRRELGYCGNGLGLAGFKEPLYLTDSAGHTCRLVFDCGRCEMRLQWLGRSG